MAKKFLTPINITNLSSDPVSANEGDIYFNTSIDTIKIYSNGIWTEISGGSEIYFQSSQPVSPNTGNIWVDSNQTVLSVNANDFVPKTGGTFTGVINAPTANAGTNNNQVATTEFVVSALSGVSGGAEISDTAPLSPSAGSIWYNSSNGRTYLYYEDGSSNQWVEIGTASLNPVANYDGGSPSSVFGGVSSLDGGGVT